MSLVIVFVLKQSSIAEYKKSDINSLMIELIEFLENDEHIFESSKSLDAIITLLSKRFIWFGLFTRGNVIQRGNLLVFP